VLAVAFAIVALARPQWGSTWDEVKQQGLDIVVAVDTSKSMLATDIAPNRLERAKLAALELMQDAKLDRMGLVAFAGSAFLQCPLTIDDVAFQQSVQSLNVNTIPQGGTALAAAIDTALTAFKEGDNFKVLVLFTDGEDNDEGALAAADRAAKEGMKIFTVGIGTAEGDLLRVTDANGNSDYIRDEQGNVVKSHLNEDLLRQIATKTGGGFYLPLRGAKTIDTLYEKGLAPLPKSQQASKLVKRFHEQYYWPLALAILLLLVEILFPERRPVARVEPAKKSSQAGKISSAPTVAVLLILFLLPVVAFGSPGSALKDYQSNKFVEAQKEYERLAATNKVGDMRLVFDAGTAAYRGTNYDAAIALFTSAASAQDIKVQEAAYFNLGNTQFRVGQTAKDLDGMQENWEAAVRSYQSAVKLNTNDVDAAFNLAFAKNGVAQILALREAARRAKEAADEATRRRNYHIALEIMEQITKQNPTAKQFEEFTKKLKDIDAIANPNTAQPVQP
jgi:Ca-activated chloride channel family protein